MINPAKAYSAAQSVNSSSDAALLAQAVATMRDGAPFSMKGTPYGMLPHWQAIIFEDICLSNMRAELGG